MSDMISRKQALKYFRLGMMYTGGEVKRAIKARRSISSERTATKQPFFDNFICSACKREIDCFDYGDMHYCPRCGAKFTGVIE